MGALTVVAGCGLVAVALVDLAWTTVAAGSGGGPLTRRLAAGLWRVALRGHRRTGGHRLLSAGGPIIVFTLFVAWVATVLLGWSLVFLSAEGAVVASSTSVPAGTVDRLYFTGYTVFTLGIGDFRPDGGPWQLATVAATGSGLVLVTLGITYLVGVASAVTQRRQLASGIAVLGADAAQLLQRSWDGTGFAELPEHLRSFVALLDATRQRHLTYPVLHYFHSEEPQSAAPLQIAHLAQAVDALRWGVEPAVRPAETTLGPLVRTIDSFLDTLSSAHITAAEAPIAPLDLQHLRAVGIPTVDEGQYRRALAGDERRRRLLAGLLADDGWPRA